MPYTKVETPDQARRELRGYIERGHYRSLPEAVARLIEESATASPSRAHIPPGFTEPTRYIDTPSARSLTASLVGDSLPGLLNADGRPRRTPRAAPSSSDERLETAILASSRIAQAGASLVIVPEAQELQATGQTGAVVAYSTPGHFRIMNAAPWETVDVNVDGTIPESPHPIATAPIDFSAAKTKAIRFSVTRRQRLDYSDQLRLVEHIVMGLTAGFARAADAVLLDALAAAGLQNFTLARAAAADLRFDELRAIVGTAGTGAAVDQNGSLRAAGIAGELTADTSGTYIGAWNRAGVAVRDGVVIGVERMGLQGKIEFTAWAGFVPLVPVPGAFFTLGP